MELEIEKPINLLAKSYSTTGLKALCFEEREPTMKAESRKRSDGFGNSSRLFDKRWMG